jgi:hypothetical protein
VTEPWLDFDKGWSVPGREQERQAFESERGTLFDSEVEQIASGRIDMAKRSGESEKCA